MIYHSTYKKNDMLFSNFRASTVDDLLSVARDLQKYVYLLGNCELFTILVIIERKFSNQTMFEQNYLQLRYLSNIPKSCSGRYRFNLLLEKDIGMSNLNQVESVKLELLYNNWQNIQSPQRQGHASDTRLTHLASSAEHT